MIKTYTRPPRLLDFLSTDEGHSLWDSLEVQLIEKNESVLKVVGNYELVNDTLGLINQETNLIDVTKAQNYIVEGYAVVDLVNYIFIKEAKIC